MEVMKTYNDTNQNAMRLYNQANRRLYLNASERERFLTAANLAPTHTSALALVLFYTGCRLSEALALTPSAIQSHEQVISFRSLKKRSQHHIREVPVPDFLATLFCDKAVFDLTDDQKIWLVDRTTAYRWIKDLMKQGSIRGPQACPKGLRHSFGIHAIQCGVQINMLKKWMGHTSVETTAIYANAIGPEERAIAEKMWE